MESLLLSCRALSSPTTCRFIPAHSVPFSPSETLPNQTLPLGLPWSMFSYDPALLAAVQTTPQSINDVVQILQNIESICVDDDGLKWFNWLYLQVTQAIQARVAAGGFTDPAWLAQLDVQFAPLYFSALKSRSPVSPRPLAGKSCLTAAASLQSPASSSRWLASTLT